MLNLVPDSTTAPGKPAGWDELIDRGNRLRGPWRRMLGTLLGMGWATLAERTAELDRACAEEGAASLLAVPNAGTWRCDAVPFLLTESEFNSLAAGLAQRAELLELVLADLYGPRRLLAEGTISPLPWSIRAILICAICAPRCRRLQKPRSHRRGICSSTRPMWCAGRMANGACSPIAPASRRGWPMCSRTGASWRGCCRNCSRPWKSARSGRSSTPGRTRCSGWRRRMRAIRDWRCSRPAIPTSAGSSMWCWRARWGCTLVEAGDLTVRDDALFVKTLRGLQPIHVLLRRQPGASVDPLELAGGVAGGIPGLLSAQRQGCGAGAERRRRRLCRGAGSGCVSAAAGAGPDRHGAGAAERADPLAGRSRLAARCRGGACQVADPAGDGCRQAGAETRRDGRRGAGRLARAHRRGAVEIRRRGTSLCRELRTLCVA